MDFYYDWARVIVLANSSLNFFFVARLAAGKTIIRISFPEAIRDASPADTCLLKKFLFTADLCTDTPATTPSRALSTGFFLSFKRKNGVEMVLYPLDRN
jgi:hypothetical protein